MAALLNDLSGLSEEETSDFAEHLANSIPDFTDAFSAAKKMPAALRSDMMRRTVHGSIDVLLRIHASPYIAHASDPGTREQRTDRSLRQSANALAGVTDEQWASFAKEGTNPDDYRKNIWRQVFNAYYQE